MINYVQKQYNYYFNDILDLTGEIKPESFYYTRDERIKKIEDKDSNNISNESAAALEAKSDFIEKHILTESKTRAVLIRIMRELGMKWFELPHREQLVKEVMERYLKKKLKKMVLCEDIDDE